MPDNQPQLQSQNDDDAPPIDPGAYLDSLRKQDAPPVDPSKYLDDLHRQSAVQHLKEYDAGRLELSPRELVTTNLVAQGGKPLLQRFYDKASQLPSEMASALKPAWEGIKGAAQDEWNRSQEAPSKPFLENFKEGLSTGPRVAVAGLGATAKSIPATANAIAQAGQFLDPQTHLQELVAPQLAQQQEAQTAATGEAAQHYTNEAVDYLTKKSGVDTNRLDAKIAEQVVPLAALSVVPVGGIEKGIGDLTSNVLRAGEKTGAALDKGAASTLSAAAPLIAKAPKAAAGAALGAVLGHGALNSELAGALIASVMPGAEGKAGALSALIKSSMSDVKNTADTVLKSPWGQPAVEAIQGAGESKIAHLQEEIADLRKGLKPKEGETTLDVDKKASDGSWLHSEKNLSGDEKKIRIAQDEASNLQQKVGALRARAKFNQFNDDLTRYVSQVGANTAIGAGIGAGFAGASTPPGDASGIGQSALAGSVLGLAGGVAGVPKAMQSERAAANANVLNEAGSKVTPQVNGLSPDRQSNLNRLGAVLNKFGFQVEPVTPQEYIGRPEVIAAKQTTPEEAGIAQAPNGHIDLANKKVVLNIDAIPEGVGEHEFGHFSQLFGKILRIDRPDLMNIFGKTYDQAAGLTGKLDRNLESERDAEIARILLQQEPIENFYGGKRIFDTLDPQNIVNAIKARFSGYKVDPTLQAPYSQGDLNQMKQRMFQVGEEAAKAPRNAPTEPQAASIRSDEQTQSSAPTEAPSKTVEQAVNEVDQAARPQVIPARQPSSDISGEISERMMNEAQPFVEAMGQSPENARAKIESAMGDLIRDGKAMTPENIVVYALRRAIPKPEGAVEHGEFAKPGYTAVDPSKVVNEVDQVARSTPQTNEESSHQPTETVPQTSTEPAPERGVASEVQAPAEQPNAPDYQAIRTEAENAKREELSGTRRKTKDAEIARAGLEAMAQAHAKHVGDSDLVTWRTDRFGDTSVGGKRLDLNDPFHQHLIEKAGLNPKQVEYVNQFSDNMGNLVGLENYSHAAKEGEASGVSRKAEQKESTAQQRAEKQGDTQNAPVNIIPTWIKINQPSNRVTVHGFNPDKFLSNGVKLESYPESGFKKVYPRGVNDPQIAEDLSNWLVNNRNGYTGDGRKQIEGTPLTQVKPNADYKPAIIPHDRFQVLNAMMGSPEPMGKTPKSTDAQILGQQNAGFVRPNESIFNQVRAKLSEKGDVRDLLENVNESLRPENMSGKVSNKPVADEHLLRPSGAKSETVKAIADVIGEQGAPRWSQSGFMPATHPQVDTPEFKRWFGDSKAIDENGKPLVVFHGTQRPDRIGSRFKKSRATSGPMPFFTDDPEVASGYAKGKADTSLEAPEHYVGWFKIRPEGSREMTIDRAWYHLSPEQRLEITKKLYTTGYENADEGEGAIVNNSRSIMGDQSIDWELKEARGNALKAATEIWLTSGHLFNSEEDFLDVLKALGVKGARLDDPHAAKSAVYPVYLSIKNPLDTSNIPPNVIDALKQAAKRRRGSRYGADQWDKNTVSGRDWIERIEGDQKEGTTHAWTSIPDWATEALQNLGYDGIRDRGGKYGGDKHNVWIPFDETQIKSAIGNRGTFDPTSKNISFMPATPKHLDAVAKELGLRYDGPSLGGKAYQFTDDKTNSSLDVPANATPEQVKQLFETSRANFKNLPQFMPSPNPKAVDKAAVRMPDGRIFSDVFHPLAFSEAINHYSTSTLAKWLEQYGDNFAETGWLDRQGKWLGRKEAQDRAEEIGQATKSDLDSAREHFGNLQGRRGLESLEFARARKFKRGGVVKVPKIVRPLSRARVSA